MFGGLRKEKKSTFSAAHRERVGDRLQINLKTAILNLYSTHKHSLTELIGLLKVIHAQLIFQLQSFPYDPKYIDLYRVSTNYLSKDPSVLDDSKIRSLILSLFVTLCMATRHVYISRGRRLRFSSTH